MKLTAFQINHKLTISINIVHGTDLFELTIKKSSVSLLTEPFF